jgi:hypothetical protein
MQPNADAAQKSDDDRSQKTQNAEGSARSFILWWRLHFSLRVRNDASFTANGTEHIRCVNA